MYEMIFQEAAEKERQENPYREIIQRLTQAEAKMRNEGLQQDADELGKVKNWLADQVKRGYHPQEIPLWSKSYPPSSPDPGALLKLAGKLGLASSPFDPQREFGGVILGKGGFDRFSSFTKFHPDLKIDPLKAKWHGPPKSVASGEEIPAPQEGDVILSWEPSERAKQILAEIFGRDGAIEDASTHPNIGSQSTSNVEYVDTGGHSRHVQFNVRNSRGQGNELIVDGILKF